MPISTLFPEFRDEYAQVRYPFADNATLSAATTGTPAIPADTFVDGSLYLFGNIGLIFLSQIVVSSQFVMFTISDRFKRLQATATIDLAATPDQLDFQDADGRAAGLLIADTGRLANFGAWPLGTHDFTIAATEFSAAVIIPLPESGVLSLRTGRGELLTGDVWLVGDQGVVLREENGDIRVDIVGDPLFLRRLCDESSRFHVPRFIRTINGCPPDQFGNYNFTVGSHFNRETILRIYANDSGLVIEAVGQQIGRP